MGPVLMVIGLIAIIAGLGIPVESFWGVVALLVAAGLWQLSLMLWPLKKCRACDGAGSRGPWALRRTCGQCEGTGTIPRLGAK
jgi:hypothetical protein